MENLEFAAARKNFIGTLTAVEQRRAVRNFAFPWHDVLIPIQKQIFAASIPKRARKNRLTVFKFTFCAAPLR